MREWVFLPLVLLTGQCCWAANINLGDECPSDPNGVSCDRSLTINMASCDQGQVDASGYILSPGFNPDGENYVTDELTGNYRILFKSQCENSVIELTVTEDDIMLDGADNKLKMGDGDVIGSNSFFSFSGDDDQLGGSVTTKNNAFWMDLRIGTRRGVEFNISYTVVILRRNDTYHTDSWGTITSPDYSLGSTYPSGYEQRSFIDVSSNYPDANILLTLHDVDLAGGYGDFLLIGRGGTPFQDSGASLISWSNPERNFTVMGPTAYVVFKSFSSRPAGDSRRGFWLTYRIAQLNLTTPVPPSTTPTPTPAPDYSETRTVLVDLHNPVKDWSTNVNEVASWYRTTIATISNCHLNSTSESKRIQEKDVDILFIEECYAGWNADMEKCMQVNTAVTAKKLDGEPVLTTAALREAVKKCRDKFEIYLPDEFINIYFYAVLASAGIILLVVLLLVLLWWTKLQDFYKQQQELFKVQTARMEKEEMNGRDSSIGPIGGLNSRKSPWKRGIENPNFVLDEGLGGDDALEYDPETGAAVPPSTVFSWMNKQSAQENTKNGLWSDNEDEQSEEETYFQRPPSIVSSISVGNRITGSSVSSAPTRSILKKTNSDTSAYDAIPPPNNEKTDGFEDVPLHRSENIYENPVVYHLDLGGRDSIGETQF